MTIAALEYEPYDDKTPRLSYSQVATLVMKLPDDALAVLMRGPIEVDGTCNACLSLEPLADEGCEEAKLLMAWHDKLNTSERFNGILEHWVKNPHAFETVDEERHLLLGSIQYARCCVLYALARVEVHDRRERSQP